MNKFPATAVAIAYSTYEDRGIKPIDDLRARGYTVYYSQYHSIADQLWVLVDQLRPPLPDHIWKLPPSALPGFMESVERHVEKERAHEAWKKDMESKDLLRFIKVTRP